MTSVVGREPRVRALSVLSGCSKDDIKSDAHEHAGRIGPQCLPPAGSRHFRALKESPLFGTHVTDLAHNAALIDIEKHVDLDSQDGQEIASIVASLGESCPH